MSSNEQTDMPMNGFEQQRAGPTPAPYKEHLLPPHA